MTSINAVLASLLHPEHDFLTIELALTRIVEAGLCHPQFTQNLLGQSTTLRLIVDIFSKVDIFVNCYVTTHAITCLPELDQELHAFLNHTHNLPYLSNILHPPDPNELDLECSFPLACMSNLQGFERFGLGKLVYHPTVRRIYFDLSPPAFLRPVNSLNIYELIKEYLKGLAAFSVVQGDIEKYVLQRVVQSPTTIPHNSDKATHNASIAVPPPPPPPARPNPTSLSSIGVLINPSLLHTLCQTLYGTMIMCNTMLTSGIPETPVLQPYQNHQAVSDSSSRLSDIDVSLVSPFRHLQDDKTTTRLEDQEHWAKVDYTLNLADMDTQKTAGGKRRRGQQMLRACYEQAEILIDRHASGASQNNFDFSRGSAKRKEDAGEGAPIITDDTNRRSRRKKESLAGDDDDDPNACEGDHVDSGDSDNDGNASWQKLHAGLVAVLSEYMLLQYGRSKDTRNRFLLTDRTEGDVEADIRRSLSSNTNSSRFLHGKATPSKYFNISGATFTPFMKNYNDMLVFEGGAGNFNVSSLPAYLQELYKESVEEVHTNVLGPILVNLLPHQSNGVQMSAQEVGKLGELLVYLYLLQVEGEEVEYMSLYAPTPTPFDLKITSSASISPGNKANNYKQVRKSTRFIEVKTTRHGDRLSFPISLPEFQFMLDVEAGVSGQSSGPGGLAWAGGGEMKFVIYRVFSVGDVGRVKLCIIRNPVQLLQAGILKLSMGL